MVVPKYVPYSVIPFNPNGARYGNIDEVVYATILRGAMKSINLEGMNKNPLTRAALNKALI